MIDTTGRHPAIQEAARFFASDHLTGQLALVASMCDVLAEAMIANLPDSPQLEFGLYKLQAARDCFVRGALPRPPAAPAAPQPPHGGPDLAQPGFGLGATGAAQAPPAQT